MAPLRQQGAGEGRGEAIKEKKKKAGGRHKRRGSFHVLLLTWLHTEMGNSNVCWVRNRFRYLFPSALHLFVYFFFISFYQYLMLVSFFFKQI